jgi:hypothetical protein
MPDDYSKFVSEEEILLPDAFPRPENIDFADTSVLFDQMMKLYAVACRPNIDLLIVEHRAEHLIVVDDIVAEQPCHVVGKFCIDAQLARGEAAVMAAIWSHLAVDVDKPNPIALHVHMWIGTNPNNVTTREIPL